MKNYWQIKPVRLKPIKIHFNLDTDRDGIKDWKDCRPFNRYRQDDTFEDLQQNPKKIIGMTYEEYQNIVIPHAKKLPVIKKVNDYEILKSEQDGTYYARDAETLEGIMFNRTSVAQLEKDIKKGQGKEVYKTLMDVHSAKDKYDLQRKSFEYEKREIMYGQPLGQPQKRFPVIQGQLVLDIGAGIAPDARATHAIDLTKPSYDFSGIDYKYGIDLNKETIQLPYPDQMFHRVVSYGALGYNFESKNIYKEIYRILKYRGKLEVSRPSKNTQSYMKNAGFNLSVESFYDPVRQRDFEVIVGTKVIRNH